MGTQQPSLRVDPHDQETQGLHSHWKFGHVKNDTRVSVIDILEIN